MDKSEIRQFVQEEVGALGAHYFGLIKELIMDQFALAREGQQMFEETTGRRFEKIEEKLDQVILNTNRNSLDILELQDSDKESWRKINELEQEYDLLNSRVVKLETKLNYV